MNPFRQGLHGDRIPAPTVLVIFGATGDLTHRKLMPAVYNLALARLLPPGFSVLGVARRDWDDAKFRDEAKAGIGEFSRKKPVDDVVWDDLAQGVGFVRGNFTDEATYTSLKQRLEELDRTRATGGNRVFYLSVPPADCGPIVKHLAEAGLIADPKDRSHATRVVCEKPHGTDLASSRELDSMLHSVLDESQIFRIDHYLGKEAVQNLLAFRFANSIFEPLWNRQHIDHVQITAAEEIGIEGRGKFYETAGAMRDIVQNHAMQLVTLTAMEPLAAIDEASVRDEKVKVLRAFRPLSAEGLKRDVVRAQYTKGGVAGAAVPGYREEKDVASDSTTETYLAMKLEIDNWRWRGVPFYVRAGKRLTHRVTEISVHFKAVPLPLFGDAAPEPNVLALRIQPDEGITLRFVSKVPGTTMALRPVNMDFRYGTTFGHSAPEAYERLLLDVMLGDPTLFTRADEVDWSWRHFDPILAAWKGEGAKEIPTYQAGTWGPASADELIERDGRKWRSP